MAKTDVCPPRHKEDGDLDVKVVNTDLQKEQFDSAKLFSSVYYPSREHDLSEERAEEIGDIVLYELKSWMGEHEDNVFTTQEIEDRVIRILERIDEQVAFLYESHLDLS